MKAAHESDPASADALAVANGYADAIEYAVELDDQLWTNAYQTLVAEGEITPSQDLAGATPVIAWATWVGVMTYIYNMY